MGKVLVDTSVWIDFLTQPAVETSKALRSLLDHDAVCITGGILAELLHGSQSAQQTELLLTRLHPLEFLQTTREVWIMAGRTVAELRRRGLNLPLNDCVVAAVAQAHDCSIYTTDAHFSRIPHVKLYRP